MVKILIILILDLKIIFQFFEKFNPQIIALPQISPHHSPHSH